VEFAESPSWVDVATEGVDFEGIHSWGPLTSHDEINRLTQINFDLLRKKTIWASGNWIDALVQLRESTKQLLSAQSQTEIRVGTPGAFGASVGVVNAFDGLRHLMELLEDAESKFDSMPYVELVTLTKIDQSVVAMIASDPWATETSELRKKIDVNASNLGLLRDRSVGPLVAMYNYYTDKGNSVPGNRLKNVMIVKLQTEMVHVQQVAAVLGPTQGIGTFGGAQSGFRFQVPQGGGGSGMSELEARILAAEQKNALLENELGGAPLPLKIRSEDLQQEAACLGGIL
jgi:hypothetical protein